MKKVFSLLLLASPPALAQPAPPPSDHGVAVASTQMLLESTQLQRDYRARYSDAQVKLQQEEATIASLKDELAKAKGQPAPPAKAQAAPAKAPAQPAKVEATPAKAPAPPAKAETAPAWPPARH